MRGWLAMCTSRHGVRVASSAAGRLRRWSSGAGTRRLAIGLILLTGACCGWLPAAGPSAGASANCGGGHETDGVTADYSGTWTYTSQISQGSGNPDAIAAISLSWRETFDGTTGCWTLQSDGGSASMSGSLSPPGGPNPNCSATLGLSPDAAANFQANQPQDAADLTLYDPLTGEAQSQYWYVEENVPLYYAEPFTVLQSSDTNLGDFCYQPGLPSFETIATTQFTGSGCHFQGSGSTSGDFLSFPVNGGATQTDDCTYSSTDEVGESTEQTLQQSVTLSSGTPHCSNVAVSTTEEHAVTFTLPCTWQGSQPLAYTVLSGAKQPGGLIEHIQGDQVTWGPTNGFTGTSTFTFDASPVDGVEDGPPGNTATATITVCQCCSTGSAATPSGDVLVAAHIPHLLPDLVNCYRIVVFVNKKPATTGDVRLAPGERLSLDAEVFLSNHTNPVYGNGRQLEGPIKWVGFAAGTAQLSEAIDSPPSWQSTSQGPAKIGQRCGAALCAVAGYDPTNDSATIKPLPDGDLSKAQIPKLYFLPSTDQNGFTNVSVSGRYASEDLEQTVTVVIDDADSDFHARTCPFGLGEPGPDGLVPGNTWPPPGLSFGHTRGAPNVLQFGCRTSSSPGITFTGGVKDLPRGETGMVQLISRESMTWPFPAPRVTSLSGHVMRPYGTDSSFLYRGVAVPEGTELKTDDSPGAYIGLAQGRPAGAGAFWGKFVDFLMYRDTRDPGSIWVPVAKMDWEVAGAANCINGRWALGPVSEPFPLVGSTFFSGEPEWSNETPNSTAPPTLPKVRNWQNCPLIVNTRG